MHQRCTNPKNYSYPYYGAKGIRVCDRWMSFANFVADMGVKPAGMTLDRIDSSKDYSPVNCRWASIPEQNRNRSNTRLLTFNGVEQTVGAWAKQLGIRPTTLHRRLREVGLPPELALTLPLDRHGTRRALRQLKEVA
jgi:hypothetical protein